MCGQPGAGHCQLSLSPPAPPPRQFRATGRVLGLRGGKSGSDSPPCSWEHRPAPKNSCRQWRVEEGLQLGVTAQPAAQGQGQRKGKGGLRLGLQNGRRSTTWQGKE